MTEATGDFTAKVESANNWVGKLSSTLAVVDLARNAFEQIDSAVKTFNASGITLDSQMHDLSAVAGVVGEKAFETLKQIGDIAMGEERKKIHFSFWVL